MPVLSKYLIIIGIVIIIAGLVIWAGGFKNGWPGNLPGDIRVEKENFKFYFPITTMIIISIVLSLLFWIFRRF